MALPVRLSIPTCAGCGSMRVFEREDHVCRERRLEIVSGGEYDELAAAATACGARVEAFSAVVDALLGADPSLRDCQSAYESLQRSARAALTRFGAQSRHAAGEEVSPAEAITIWRCPECGSLDQQHECIDVCVWRPVDWVAASDYEDELARLLADRELEDALVALLRRLAFATPRGGAWERNLRALQSQARTIATTVAATA